MATFLKPVSLSEVYRQYPTFNAARSSIFRWVRLGLFPQFNRIAPKKIVWDAKEIEAWMIAHGFFVNDKNNVEG